MQRRLKMMKCHSPKLERKRGMELILRTARPCTHRKQTVEVKWSEFDDPGRICRKGQPSKHSREDAGLKEKIPRREKKS